MSQNTIGLGFFASVESMAAMSHGKGGGFGKARGPYSLQVSKSFVGQGSLYAGLVVLFCWMPPFGWLKGTQENARHVFLV